MMTKKIVLLLLIVLIIPKILSANTNENSLQIAVLKFENKAKIESYNYLEKSIQNSILSSISVLDNMDITDKEIADKYINEYDISMDSLKNIPKLLKFGIKTGANIIITGEYNIDEENGYIDTGVFIYSILQKEIIIALTHREKIDNIFDLIDQVALDTRKELRDRFDDINTIINNIKNDNKQVKYITEPHIEKVNHKGIHVLWETNKQTVSSLYFNFKENFKITNTQNECDDISKDAIKHYSIINIDVLNMQDVLYFKTYDIDFLNNEIYSKEQKINQETIYDRLINNYDKERSNFKKSINSNIKEQKFKKALELSLDFKEFLGYYKNIVDVGTNPEEADKLIEILKVASEAETHMEEAYNYIVKRDYKSASNEYEKVIELINKHNIESVLTKKDIEKLMKRIDSVGKYYEYLKEGDLHLENKEYPQARDSYSKAIQIAQNEDIMDMVSVKKAKNKLDAVPIEILRKSAVNFGIGGGYGDFDALYKGIIPAWEISYSYRLNRFVSIGGGINNFYIEINTLLFIINNIGLTTITSELYFKPDILIGFIPSFQIGGGASVGYRLGFGLISVYADIGIWGLYGIHYDNILSYMVIRTGIVLNF